jgi:hypothetical protein
VLEVLVMREDGCVMSQRPAHNVDASTSHAALPFPDIIVAHPEQVLGRAGAPPTHFDDARAAQELWQEFQDQGASINNALTEALRVYGGPSWWIFQASVFRWIRDSLLRPLCVCAFPYSALSRVLNCW